MPSRRSQEMLEIIRSHKKLASSVSNGMLMKVDMPVERAAKIRVNGTSALMRLMTCPFRNSTRSTIADFGLVNAL